MIELIDFNVVSVGFLWVFVGTRLNFVGLVGRKQGFEQKKAAQRTERRTS